MTTRNTVPAAVDAELYALQASVCRLRALFESEGPPRVVAGSLAVEIGEIVWRLEKLTGEVEEAIPTPRPPAMTVAQQANDLMSRGLQRWRDAIEKRRSR